MIIEQEVQKESLFDHFSKLDDPRIERNKKHNLLDIVTIAVGAVISRADGGNEVEIGTVHREDWLKTFLGLPNRIPSQDTFNRVFSALCPKSFFHCFNTWIHSVTELMQRTVIGLDGKKIRKSYDRKFGKSALQLVSA